MEKICPFISSADKTLSFPYHGVARCQKEDCMAWGRVDKVKHTEFGVYEHPKMGCRLIEKEGRERD